MPKLKFAYVMKGIIATTLILLAIAFAIAMYEANDVGGTHSSCPLFLHSLTAVAAILEWLIAFGYTFYLLTFAYDLRMAKGVHRGQFGKRQIIDMRERGIPISQAIAGHEGTPRPSDEHALNANVYPDGYSTYRGGNYAPSTTTSGTVGTHDGYPMITGNARGANGGYHGYNAQG